MRAATIGAAKEVPESSQALPFGSRTGTSTPEQAKRMWGPRLEQRQGWPSRATAVTAMTSG